MGQGDMGQLGLGEEMVERKKPFPVGGALEDKKVVQVVCGGMHTVALTKEGRVRGGRRRGQWVTLHTLTPSLPTPFHCLSTTSHSHFLHSPTFTLHTLTPPLPAPSHCHYSHSHAITSHTLSLSLFIPSLHHFSHPPTVTPSQVFTWGCNDEGALGRTVGEEGEEFAAGEVERLSGVMVVQVSAGDSHTAALTTSGSIYCWGVFRVGVASC